jgi:hypothetical protein
MVVRVVVSLRARSDILAITLTSPNEVPSQPIGSWFDFRGVSMNCANFRSSARIEANCAHRCADF